MTLTLLAVSLNEQPLTQPITACFDASGGTIGRADHNTMALPDPERHISRLQAEIIGTGSQYLIKNVGAANPIIIGNRTLVQGDSTLLAHNDQVRIGGYLLQVVVDAEDGADITRGRAAIAAAEPTALRSNAWPREPSTPPPVSTPRPGAAPAGLSDIATPLSSSNPFADLIGGPPAAAPVAAPPAFARPAPGTKVSGDTFADLMPAPAGIPRSSQALGAAMPAPAPGGKLPDDFDPFAAPHAVRPDPFAPAPAARSGSGGAFDDLIPSAPPSSLDDVFGLRPAAASGGSHDPLANFMAGLPAGGAGAGAPVPAGPGGLSVDPLALFGGSDRPAPAAAPSAANHTPDLMAGFVPPQVVPPPARAPAPRAVPPAPEVANPVLPTRFDWQISPPPPPITTPAARIEPEAPPVAASPPVAAAAVDFDFGEVRPPAPPMAPPMAAPPFAPPAPAAHAPTPQPPAAALPPAAMAPGSADTDALWRAFCEGAAIPPELLPGLTPALMREVGGVLRAAIEGTLQLIAVRATTKHELRAAVTVIQARGNNPLKFSPDAATGIEQLLRPTMRGFLAGPAAMTDAMNDLVGHSIGTVAGMRAALDGMLGRFAPQQLESKLVGSSLLDSVLPMNRKAKLWELYLQHFETIRDEAQEDFHNLFGKAFLAAYEQQLERLKRNNGGG
ncbi:type VI secretion system-associated FHA domain protein TagH [Aquincola sp. S2]|uniref:Type VI secretion system-associated FHA domain protein TagH n=1 Tax=Pseudaquabacterium terrae TaxID=2732868 RepID=A0ABX2ECQ1_9BURK|nr:type VI secretion system-associated FHA domain protein TagH [Aquabacterium terrae]NRF66436.1 type VI secretion system-associated FHA domain protein TagH [Aquabacterium terrae]